MYSMSAMRYGFTPPGTTSIAVLLVSSAVVAAQLSGCAAAPPGEDPPSRPASPEEVAGWQMVDLSHAYAGDTLYWPTDTDGFRLDTLAEGETPGGYFYAAKAFATAEHGEAATRLLIEDRRAGLLGIDTASIDHGQSTDFIAHQIGAAAGVPNLENVADLSGLPPTGFLLAALPMKIEGGTGAPVRIVALIP